MQGKRPATNPTPVQPALPTHLSFFGFGTSSLPDSFSNVSLGLIALLRPGIFSNVLHD